MSTVNNLLDGFDSIPQLKTLKLTYNTDYAVSETLNIPNSFANHKETLEFLDLTGPNMIYPIEQQRIKIHLSLTDIAF